MYRFEHHDRRRLVAATAITFIALPSLWLSNRSGDSGAPNVATAGVVVVAEAAAPHASAAGTVDALGTPGGAFLERPEYPLDRRSPVEESADKVINIAVPAAPDHHVLAGRASFRSTLASPDVCLVRGVPFNAKVRVTNLDNGHAITCTAAVSPVGSPHDVVLHTTAFARIADLTDAPVPVEITW